VSAFSLWIFRSQRNDCTIERLTFGTLGFRVSLNNKTSWHQGKVSAGSRQPETGVLWTVVNERDELGSDLVPDYLTSVKEGGFYGWPFSYYGQHRDPRVTAQRPDLVAKAINPDYASATIQLRLDSHSLRALFCRSDTDMAPSSVNTGHGTTNLIVDIK
jgi:hypothetical protein